MAKSRNINMFLIDGEVTGVIKCTLSNWTGVIYKIPRTKILSKAIKERQHLVQSGIYFLLGKDENTGKDMVYIGQAGNRKNGEGILRRVVEHTRGNNDYFNEVIVLTTQTNSFGPTEISYLEHKFTLLAKETGRYVVRNGNEPSVGNVTEEKESELDEIIENSKMIIGTLGHRMFVPIMKKDKEAIEENSEDMMLYLKRKSRKSNREIKASCKMTSEGFVVLKGSMIEMIDSDNVPEVIKKLRAELKQSGIITEGTLNEDQFFTSPSYAAGFVIGGYANGRTDWKDKHGISLKQREEKESTEIL